MTPDEILLVLEQLKEYYPETRDAYAWLGVRHPLLNGRRAIDCTFTEVWAILEQLRTGAYV